MSMQVVALGELLIDFTMRGVSAAGMRLFEQNPGGAPANVLCGLARLGWKTAFIGKVGRDMHGTFLKETLAAEGIDITGLVEDEDVFTTLAFVQIAEDGERSFSFSRKPGADTCLQAAEVPETLLQNCDIFHFGSLSLTQEPVRSATLSALKMAKEAGAVISYDPNYRASLWESCEEAMIQMRSVLREVDLIKLSLEEVELLTGFSDPDRGANHLLGLGVKTVVVTLGEKGASLYTKDYHIIAPGYVGEVVDTTGAGDSFWAGFLHGILKSGIVMNKETAFAALQFANATAMLCVGQYGAIPAMPKLADVECFMKETNFEKKGSGQTIRSER